MNNAIAYLDESAAGWERSLYAFLAEKERRSGSLRIVQSYSRRARSRRHGVPCPARVCGNQEWLKRRPAITR